MLTDSLRKKSGFTLIEILTTMTIIAVLAGLALVSFQGARKTARDGKRKADLEQIRSALEMYRADNPTIGYPANLSALTGYITLPSDPLPGRSYSYNPISTSRYNLCASLEISTGVTYSDCNGNCGTGCNHQVKNP